MKITEDRAKKEKENKGTSRSHQLQQQLVGGTSSIIGTFHLIVGLVVPCYPVCAASLLYIRPPRFPFSFPCGPPSPHPLGHHPRRMRRAVNSSVPHPRATSPWTVRLLQGLPDTTSPLFCCSGPLRGLNSKRQGEVFRLPFGGSELSSTSQSRRYTTLFYSKTNYYCAKNFWALRTGFSGQNSTRYAFYSAGLPEKHR